MKFTVDTNFIVSATQWDYSVANKLFKKLVREDHEIFTTTEILQEFIEILLRDFKYADEEVADLIDKILPFLKIVLPGKKIEVIKEDFDDNKVIECAVESQSDYILSYDNHLLKLKEYNNIKIIKPEEALGF
jgi:putative PIN family toxin of toxin-antitoxin system